MEGQKSFTEESEGVLLPFAFWKIVISSKMILIHRFANDLVWCLAAFWQRGVFFFCCIRSVVLVLLQLCAASALLHLILWFLL